MCSEGADFSHRRIHYFIKGSTFSFHLKLNWLKHQVVYIHQGLIDDDILFPVEFMLVVVKVVTFNIHSLCLMPLWIHTDL